MNEKILFVDDDANLLAALKRGLRRQFDNLEVAIGPGSGLEYIEQQGPFAVVVADMRMPGMDGVQFLSHVKSRSPDTVRIMLTGNADLQTAINAVNEGNIFRFLTKPCAQDTLALALRAGLEQHRLITAERELLEKTLMGSIKVLTEMLSLANPVAFSRATRIRKYVKHIGTKVYYPKWWQFEISALLSQIGCVTLPPDMLDKVFAQATLTDEEQEMFASHPIVGRNLLANIPRLETIAQIITAQQKPFSLFPPPETMTEEANAIALGAQVLKVALDFDQLIINGLPHREALAVLRARGNEYNTKLISALDSLELEELDRALKMVKVKELNTGMVADEDIEAQNGLLLVPKGQEITYPVIERLRNFSRHTGVLEPFRVLVAHREADKGAPQ